MNLLAALLVVAMTPAPAAPELVALGDSFAAGTGASREDCRRDGNAHSALYAAERRMTLVFEACMGATTDDVHGQASRITPESTLVTLTVGGNDAGFVDVMVTCSLNGDADCVRRVDEAERFIRADLPGRLDRLYAVVRSRTSAEVVVMGYPRLFETSGTCLMSAPKRTALNRAADALNEVVAARAAAAGFSFGDVRDAFAGHGLCGGDSWVNGVVPLAIKDSFHPNAAGHRLGYLPVLTRVVG
jgi:lysophospholipase L1-like esterase